MKKNLLDLPNVTILSKKQLRAINGGASFTCSCTGQPGTWTGNYSSLSQAINSINIYCDNGGTCTNNSNDGEPGVSGPLEQQN
ncbi:hypothetical protein GTQ40_13130 [Flavobacteriaceae bacterium R38]|nr:hypothetical protein [Flavobacteriaceae bacterium R38]